MPSECTHENPDLSRGISPGFALFVLFLFFAPALKLAAQSAPTAPAPAGATSSSFQGSVPVGEVSPQTLDLTLDDAMQRGLRNNLGAILTNTETAELILGFMPR